MGVESLAASLNEEVDTIADTVEPYCLRQGILSAPRAGAPLLAAFEHFGLNTQRKPGRDVLAF